ncbi:FBP domain-containing protein [Nocardioides mesophilus]|uniref:FBP domain-containing protein n=1 Tax=Nocardioides mesophilus TaxID=433659 RepID=A0A7G9R936_9ACTN|nr:FBP domain-containing protein [Nocardioides mesophilus]QNN52111.1 FBP domain-containing protein [Nocardioides mesophilus]
MNPLTEPQIRAAFVNLTKGEAQRLNVPRDLAQRPWDDLDYLGWRDPQSPARGYLVAPIGDRFVGVALRAPASSVGFSRPSMCSVCLTVRSGGVALMVAPRAGKAGKQGHSVGTDICADLSCSLYVRGKLQTGTPGMRETLTLDQRIDRLVGNLESFVARVTRPS